MPCSFATQSCVKTDGAVGGSKSFHGQFRRRFKSAKAWCILGAVFLALFCGTSVCLADADLRVITSSPQLPKIVPGGVVYVTGFIPNLGPDTATNAQLTVTPPAFFTLGLFTFSTAVPSVETNGGSLVFSLGDLSGSPTPNFSICLIADTNAPIGDYVVDVSVTATTPDPNTNNNQVVYSGAINPFPGGFLNPNGQITLLDPVGTFAGNHVETEPADLNLGGPLPIFFQRHYDSALFADGIVTSALGHNWQHNWDITLSVTGTNATVGFRRGREITFQHDGTNWNQVFNTQVGFRLVDLSSEFMLADPRSQLMYFFNINGALARLEDGLGNTNFLTYGSSLQSVTDNLNRTLTFSYDSNGLLTNVTDGIRSVSYGHTGTNLTSFTDANGKVTAYAYDAGNTNNPGLMTARTLPEGNTPVTQAYDATGRVTIQTDAAGHTNKLAYATSLGTNITTMTDAVGNTMKHVYLGTGELVQLFDEAGETVDVGVDTSDRRSLVRDRKVQATSLLYDFASGLPTRINHPANQDDVFAYTTRTVNTVDFRDLTRITRPDGRTDNYVYDALGNLISYTNRAGEVWTMTRNNRGQLLTSTNPTSGVATFTYDANARLASATDSDQGVTTFDYDTLNRLTNVTHPNPDTIRFAWDVLNRLTSVTDERTNTTAFAYDNNSRLTGITNALNQETRFQYDGLNRLVRSVDRLGHAAGFSYDPRSAPSSLVASATNLNGFVTRFQYDNRRRLTGVVDPGGKTNALGYDSEGLLSSASNPLGETVGLQRDAMGYVTSLTDPLSNQVTLVRDQMKRVTQVTDPLGRVANYTYDPRGLLASASREPDIEADYDYDALGNLIEIIDPNNRFWRFSYTPMGRMSSMSDPISRTNFYTYDIRGRLATVTYPDSATQTNTYDGANNLIRMQFSDGTDFQYAYDPLDRLTNVVGQASSLSFAFDPMDRVINTRQAGVDFGAAYDADGRLTNVTYNSGQFAVTYTYDSRDRLTSVSDTLTGTVLTMAYDDAHRLTGMTRPNGVNGNYTYDKRGFITRIEEGTVLDLRYTYDAACQVVEANFVTVPIDPTVVATTGSTNFFYDSASQITSTPGYGYDPRGRQTSRAGSAITWDGASRLRTVGTASFSYNALSDLETRVESGNTNRYFYNYAVGLNPIMAERNDNTGQFTRFYVWGPGGLLLYIINLPGNTVSFPLFDRVGSTLALTDGAGAVSDAYAYNAYGRVLSQSGTNQQPFRFNGEFGIRADPASAGLYHMRARWYDPVSTRFLSKEPIWPVLANPMKVNPYEFGLLNPTAFLDPVGTLEIVSGGKTARVLGNVASPQTSLVFNNTSFINVTISSSGGHRLAPRSLAAAGTKWASDPADQLPIPYGFESGDKAVVASGSSVSLLPSVAGSLGDRVVSPLRDNNSNRKQDLLESFKTSLLLGQEFDWRFFTSQTPSPRHLGGTSQTTASSLIYHPVYGAFTQQTVDAADGPAVNTSGWSEMALAIEERLQERVREEGMFTAALVPERIVSIVPGAKPTTQEPVRSPVFFFSPSTRAPGFYGPSGIDEVMR